MDAKNEYTPRQGKGHGKGNQKKSGSSKPPLTHFLCLPLVNETSIPQLVSSLAEFKASIPLITPPAATRAAEAGYTIQTPLVPDGAFRPLGTLHLTLGVMSLPTQERLDEALNYLQSLDLVAMLREVETQTTPSLTQGNRTHAGTDSNPDSPQPLSINLTSLYALPNARSATILHAHPLDSTSRLYPFCVNLRNKFIEAGFMYRDVIKSSKGKDTQRNISEAGSANLDGKETGIEQDNDSNNNDVPTVRTTKSIGTSERARPLLLHATIANTIYLGKRRTNDDNGGNGGGSRDGNKNKKKGKSVYKFDATELLERFGDGSPKKPTYLNEGRKLPDKVIPWNLRAEKKEEDEEEEHDSASQEKKVGSSTKEPFVWAKNIPLDRLCICEMGAKPVPHDESKGGAVLGAEYKVIGERKLEISTG